MTPFDTAWSFLKSDDADYNLEFDRLDRAGHYNPWADTVNVNLAAILPIGRSMGFSDADIDKYTANVLGRLNAHEWGHATTDNQPGVGDLRGSQYGKYSQDIDATARTEHPANILQYPESSLTAHRELMHDLNAHQVQNAGAKGMLAAMFGQRVSEDHPMRGITNIIEQLDSPTRTSMGRDGKISLTANKLTPRQKEQRFREIMGLRARNPHLRRTNNIKTAEQWDKLIAAERRKDRRRFG